MNSSRDWEELIQGEPFIDWEFKQREIAMDAPWWIVFYAIPFAIYDWFDLQWFRAKLWAVRVLGWE